MHRLWTIPEIVSIICGSLSRRDCVRLAPLHSAIWDSVIHLIWAKVPGIYCLRALLPDVYFYSREALYGQIVLTEQQWTRFDIHSKLIRELKMGAVGRDVDMLEILQKGWVQRPSGSSRSFIPAIQHLTVVLPNVCWALNSTENWTLLFSDTLLSFNLTFRATWEGDPSTNLIPCLDALRTYSPHLQNMTLQVSGMPTLDDPCFQAVAKTIRALDKLNSLGLDFTPSLPSWFVDDVLSSGHLDRIYMGAVIADEHQAEPPTSRIIPHILTDVGLSGSPTSMADLLKAINPSKVRRVIVKDSVLEIWGSFTTLAETMLDALSRFPNLNQLELDFSIDSFNTLLPLQNQLQKLVSFSIGPSSSSTHWISRRTLPQLAALLPRIEEFRIVDHGLERGTVSLDTLQCFAISCPHLRKLRIPISVESVTGTGVQSHPSIQEIDFRSSMIVRPADPRAAAETMAAMFPKLLLFSYVGKYDDEMDSDDSNMYLWEVLAGALVHLLPGLIISVSDDDEGTIGSFGDFFSGPVKVL